MSKIRQPLVVGLDMWFGVGLVAMVDEKLPPNHQSERSRSALVEFSRRVDSGASNVENSNAWFAFGFPAAESGLSEKRKQQKQLLPASFYI